MVKHKLHGSLSLKSVGKYCALLLCCMALNCALPAHEPLSFPLFYASLLCGFDPALAGAVYLISSVVSLSAYASLSAAIQTIFFATLCLVYRYRKRRMGYERLLYLAAAQIPFVFLFPSAGYELFPFPDVWQKVLFSAFLLLLSVLFEGGLHALVYRAFRSRLSAVQLTELSLIWLFLGAGICGGVGIPAFYAVSLTLLLLSVPLLNNAVAVPFAIVLSLPLCAVQASAIPVAEYALFACVALLFASYGRVASSLSLFLSFLAARFLGGLFEAETTEIVLTLLSCAVPALIVSLLPEKGFRSARNGLLFYRERTLPRIAINRNRRAVGERLYEVSSLFREIGNAFLEPDDETDDCAVLCAKLRETLCNGCPGRRKCESADVSSGMEKLVAIGCAKGQVSLVDLSAELSAACGNAAGMLFACNKLLAEYRNGMREKETERASRRLLAEQARGVSEILRDIALEQSEEYSFSEGESALARALAAAGILSSEIFVYGEGTALTVSMTLSPEIGAGKLCSVASTALGVPLSLAEKLPLSETRSCYILKRKPEFDAAFGIASRRKDGEQACGDTYSVLKIDERRFLVALSDGMGSGEKARNVSDKTLSLLESFYKAKMPSDTVLGTVNRLISYTSDEMFSCLDLAAVDLDTGAADIVKIGSPVGFILSEEELRVLEGESLPMGALDAVHPATLRAQMGENDFMLFMSDGITSAFGSSAELFSYLSGLKPLNPQSLAEEILDKALGYTGGRAEDDMTVLTVKLMKSA